MRLGAFVHRLLSLVIAGAVPTTVYAVNGAVGLEFVVLGAVIGFVYWYWGPLAL